MCGTIDFREYLLCAIYLIKQNLPTIDLIQIVSKMYDNCGKGSGRLTRTALYNLLRHTTAATIDECVEFFTEIDSERNGFVTLGNGLFSKLKITINFKRNSKSTCDNNSMLFIRLFSDELRAFFQKKPEFAHLFEIPTTAKKITPTSTAKPKSQ